MDKFASQLRSDHFISVLIEVIDEKCETIVGFYIHLLPILAVRCCQRLLRHDLM
jgi:hypothetical protein